MSRLAKAIRTVPRPMPDYTDRAYWQGTIKMSLSKFFVLCVLHHKPMHGYEVVQAVERTTNGCCSPTEGTVYPMLNEFEAGGYPTARNEIVQGRGREIYALTRKGRNAFRRRRLAGGNRLYHRDEGGSRCCGAFSDEGQTRMTLIFFLRRYIDV